MRESNYLMINIIKEERHTGSLEDLAKIIGTSKERLRFKMKHSPSIINNEWVLIRLKPVYIWYRNGEEIDRDHNLEFLCWNIHRDYQFVKSNMLNKQFGEDIVRTEYEYV